MAFGALPPNPNSLKPMFMGPDEPKPKRTKRLASHATTKSNDQEAIKDNEQVEEAQFFLQKIQELVNHKMACFAIKDAKPTKKPSNKLKMIKKQKTAKKKMIPNKMCDRLPVISNETTERLKKFVTEEMNGSDLKLVIQKKLYSTDLERGQNRLSMPLKKLEKGEFLTPDEKELLHGKGGEFDVPLLGPTLKFHEKPMKLIRWKLTNTSNYILKTNWYPFVDANREVLTVNTIVQVWSFRRDEQLCLALACVGSVDKGKQLV